MKRLGWIVMVAAIVTAPGAAFAQRVALEVDTKDLAAKAVETVEVTLDGQLLRLATRFLATQDEDEKQVARVVEGLQGIYVRSYTFAKEGEYDPALIGKFRATIGQGWQRIVNVKSVEGENVEIHTHVRGDAIDGMVVIAAEPKELTFVNIVGPIDLAQLGSLEGQFGIPRVTEKKAKEK